MKDTLTPKQEAYCQARFKGLSQRDAYKEAYETAGMLEKTVDERACRLEKECKISARLKDLQNAVADKNIWAKEDMIRTLKGICDESKCSSLTRAVAVQAIKAAAEILGYKTEKHEVTVPGVRMVEFYVVDPKEPDKGMKQDPAIVGEYTRKTET
jgi:hypothetical protein